VNKLKAIVLTTIYLQRVRLSTNFIPDYAVQYAVETFGLEEKEVREIKDIVQRHE